ncbi:unnamed protein product, partial [Oppiella nova]
MLKSTTEQTTSTQHETSTTSKPTAPTSTELNPKDPETNRKLTGWTIAGIVISSLIAVIILLWLAYKKIWKIGRARNPYRSLNDENY